MPTSPLHTAYRNPMRHIRADSAVRPYNRLPYLRLILALSFRASDRCHWRGNPQPRARRRGIPLPPSAREVARSAGRRDVDPPHPRCSSVGGDAHIAPYAAAAPRHQAKRDIPRLRARGTFAHSGKSTQKRRQKLRFWISLRAFARSLSRLFYHANAVPWKFPLNVALSLLLFSLPLLL